MPRPMDLGRAVLFAGSALLLISLFTEWYDVGLTGWEVFETLDLVLAALAVGGMLAAVRPDLLPPWAGWAVPGAAILIVVVQLVDGPPAAGDASPSGGAWVALAGSLLMAAGAALSLAAISVTVQVRERDLRRRVAAVDRRDEDLEAEDLDADADAPSAPGTSSASRGGLFGSGLGGGASSDDDAAGTPGTPKRGGRFTPTSSREEPAATAMPAPAPAPGRAEAADLERTQPLAGLPDDEDDAERS
jgi:hypothetical protein